MATTKVICVFVMSLCACVNVFTELTTSGADYLLIGVGARPIGMGEAFTAINDDIDGAYWNPAGLGGVEKAGVSLMYLKWISDYHFEHLAFVQPFLYGTVGINLEFMHAPGFDELDEYGNETGRKLNVNNLTGTLSLVEKFWNLSIGLNGKVIRRVLADYSAVAYAIDCGFIYEMEGPKLYKGVENNLSLGVAVQNIGTKVRFIEVEDPLPLNFRAGIAYTIWRDKVNNLKMSFDVYKPIIDNYNFCLGLEYILFEMVSARVGYKYALKNTDYLNGIRAGLGFKIKDYNVDFAFAPYGKLGYTYYVSASIEFGKSKSEVLQDMMNEKNNKFRGFVDEGKRLIEYNNFRQAIDEFNKALEIIPSDSEAISLKERTETLLNEEDMEFVKKEANRILALAVESMEKKNYAEAEEQYRKILEISWDTSAIVDIVSEAEKKVLLLGYFRIGVKFYEMKEYENAMNNFKSAFESDTSFQEAKIYLEKCKKEFAQSYYDMAVNRFEMKNYEIAIDYFQKGLGYDTNLKDANLYVEKCQLAITGNDYFSKAINYYSEYKYDSTIGEHKQYLKLDFKDSDVNKAFDILAKCAELHKSAMSQYKDGNISKALEIWKSVLYISPEDAEAKNNISEVGKVTEAVGKLDSIDTLIVNREYESAKKNLESAIQKTRNLLIFLPNKYFEKKLKLAELYDSIVIPIIQTNDYIKQENYDEAIKALNLALSMQNVNEIVLKKINEILEETKKIKLSMEHYKAGEVYAQRREMEKAVMEWKESLRIYPDNQKAQLKFADAICELEKVTFKSVIVSSASYYDNKPIGNVTIKNNNDKEMENIVIALWIQDYTDTYSINRVKGIIAPLSKSESELFIKFNKNVKDIEEKRTVDIEVIITFDTEGKNYEVKKTQKITFFK